MPAKKKGSSKNSKGLNIQLKVNGDKKEISKWKCHSHHHGGNFWVFGSALAMIISYAQNSSIWWAILHGILSWIYIIYKLII